MVSESKLSLLRLVPVLSSTASVTFCFTEYWTLIPFLQPSIPPQSLSTFWNSYLYQTIPGWVGFGFISASTGFLGWKDSVGLTRSLYGWGTVFALSHYVFGPTVCPDLIIVQHGKWEVAKIIERIVYGPPEEAKAGLKKWLKLHTVRMILVDIPAMACFAGGFLQLT